MKIFLVGFMGCGKSYWGKKLSEKIHIPFFDLDGKIEEQEGKSIAQIFAENGEEYFRMVEKETLYMITESHESFILATGGGTPCFFNNIDYIKKAGIAVWINCSVDCLYSRLQKEKDKRPLLNAIPDGELKSFIVKKYSTRKIYYQQAQIIAHDETMDLDKLVGRIFHE